MEAEVQSELSQQQASPSNNNGRGPDVSTPMANIRKMFDTDFPSTSPQPGTPIANATKIRRKTPLKDTLNELTAVQRLVEYFVVVSAKPRWTPPEPKEERPTTTSASNNNNNAQPRTRQLFGGRLQWSRSQEEPTEIRPSKSMEDNKQSARHSQAEKTDPNSSNRTVGNIHMPLERTDHTFAPHITARYPLEDYDDNPLNPMTIQFCFPSGDVLVPTKSYEMPKIHHFALTNERGRKVFGTCLTIMEEYVITANNPFTKIAREHEGDEEESTTGVEISVVDHQETLYLPKVVCILSTWPYLTAFREYLAQLYRLATASNMMVCPLERYILNLCQEIPAPPPGAYEVQVSILNSTIRIWAPPAKLPIAYVALPFQILFECLDLDNILTLWGAMILERKVLLLSSQHSILGVCAEILCSLLFPFRWSHLYVPLLPRMLCPMLDAPMPYLCGVVRENWLHAQQFVAADTIVVDLDSNSIIMGEMVPPVPSMPQRKWTKLKTTLQETAGHVYWRARGVEKEYRAMMMKKPSKRTMHIAGAGKQWNEKLNGLDHAFNLAYTPDSPNLLNDTMPEDEQNMWERVQDGFLRFFVAVMKGYHKFLLIPIKQSDGLAMGKHLKPSFDHAGFLASQKTEAVQFLAELCMTQQFDDFLTRRMYSPGEPDLVFFDQSIKAKINRSKLKLRKSETPLLQSAKAHKDLKKIKAVSPNGEGLPMKPYVYQIWPEEFDMRLFCEARPLPKSLVAEFDRQSLLIEKLRASVFDDDESELDGFYGIDFYPSLEVGTFTVFLFVYCALVGREWKEYAKKRRHEIMTEKAEQTKDKMERRQEKEDLNLQQEQSLLENGDCERGEVDGLVAELLSLGICDACPNEGLQTLQQLMERAQSICLNGSHADQATGRQMQLMHVHDFGPAELGEALDEFDEAREVAAAQLDLAFDVLRTINLRGLSVDSDAYISLMEACGRCGDTHRALNLIEQMRQDGFVADSDVLASFLSAFVQEGENGVDIGSTDGIRVCDRGEESDSDAYSSYLRKKLAAAEKSLSSIDMKNAPASAATTSTRSVDDEASTSSFSVKTATQSGSFLDWFSLYSALPSSPSSPPRKGRIRKRRKHAIDPTVTAATTDMVERQLTLGESLLDFIYPDLSIDTTSDTCRQCSNTLTEADICAGWTACGFRDYTTKCPKCLHRFVPQFVVTCSAPAFEGSQGTGTPLYCEFLSPWVLRRELQHFIKGEHGIGDLLQPSWRNGTGIQATIFWNLMVHFRRYRLPFSFLLQGSFKSRLILPPLPTDR